MLLKLKVKNYYSFRDEVEIDFSSHKSDAFKAAKIIAFKGQNGAGKTNLLKAFTFLTVLCGHGHKVLKTGYASLLDMDSFYFNDQPSFIMVEFYIKEKHYRYEVIFQDGTILSEKLSIRKDDDFAILIEREKDKFIFLDDRFKELKLIKIKKDLSFIPIHDMYNFDDDLAELEKINHFFGKIVSNVSPHGYYDVDIVGRIEDVTENYRNDPELLEVCSSIINSIDKSIISVEIKSAKGHEGDDIYFPVFLHSMNGKQYYLPLHKESSGIKKIYALSEHIIKIISTNGILVVDELDCHLHTSSIKTILSLFEGNSYLSGQIIFTAHSDEVIDLVDKKYVYEVVKSDNVSEIIK